MQTNKQIVLSFVEETLNKGNLHLTSQFVSDDVVEQVPFPGQGPGIEGIIFAIQSLRTAFPDLQFTIKEQIAENDKVVSRFEITGTHRAPFLGIPATHRPVHIWGIVIDQLRHGKIHDTRLIMDTLTLLTQLGAIPAPNP